MLISGFNLFSLYVNSKALNSDIELNCEDIGAAPWIQTMSDVDVDTIKTDGIYELRYTTFENMHVPSEIQSVAIFPVKFLLIVADINATYYQTILSEWGCYIRRWNQGASISSWKQFGGAASAPLPLTSGGTGATNAYTAQSNMGLMKRYTSLGHLGLSANYTIREIFSAMANNTLIELDISTINVALFPKTQGIARFFKISNNRSYAEFKCTINNGIAGSWVGYYHSDTGFSGWKKIYTSLDTVPIENGGTGSTTAGAALTALGGASTADVGNVSNLETSAKTIVGAVNEVHNALENLAVETGNVEASDVYTMQSSLGLMKRYTNFNHLTLNDGYTLKDVFMAMENNTCIEYPITSSMNITVCPINSGMLKIVRITQYFGYAEFWSNLISENSMWVGSLHSDRGFTWNKIYTSNKTVPIENGGTGATTADKALKNLKLYTSVGDLGLSYPCTTVDIIQAMPTNSEVKISINSRSGSITDLPLDYCLLTVRYSDLNRYQIFCTNMVSTGSDGTYIGNYVRKTSISWEKIITDGQVLSVANGGTGAATAAESLTVLGAQAATDNSLATNSKSIVGAINEIYTMVGTANEHLEEALGGGE